jgi:hypothetical protein
VRCGAPNENIGEATSFDHCIWRTLTLVAQSPILISRLVVRAFDVCFLQLQSVITRSTAKQATLMEDKLVATGSVAGFATVRRRCLASIMIGTNQPSAPRSLTDVLEEPNTITQLDPPKRQRLALSSGKETISALSVLVEKCRCVKKSRRSDMPPGELPKDVSCRRAFSQGKKSPRIPLPMPAIPLTIPHGKAR